MIRLKSLTKIFNPGEVNEVMAIDDLDLHTPEKQFLIIIGGNGSGKSTLLNLVAGAISPEKGHIFISGHEVTRTPEHKRALLLGRVFQDPLKGASAGLTIEENFALAAKRGEFRGLGQALNRRLRDQIRERLSLLEMGLEDRMKTKVGLLSGGQRQAITILMAVFKRPKALLLDEHTAALDPRSSRKIMRLTRQIVEEQSLTTLMITHNLAHCLDSGHRTIMMSRGRIAHDLPSDRLKSMSDQDLLALFWETQRKEDRSVEQEEENTHMEPRH